MCGSSPNDQYPNRIQSEIIYTMNVDNLQSEIIYVMNLLSGIGFFSPSLVQRTRIYRGVIFGLRN